MIVLQWEKSWVSIVGRQLRLTGCLEYLSPCWEKVRGGQKNNPFDAGWIKNVLPEERLRTVQSREEQMNSSHTAFQVYPG